MTARLSTGDHADYVAKHTLLLRKDNTMKLYNDKQIETLTSEDVLILDENNKEMDYDNVRQEFL